MGDRYVPGRPKMIGIRTSPTADGKMVQVHVFKDGQSTLLGAFPPDLIKSAGVPIDVKNPNAWCAEVKVSEELARQISERVNKQG